MTLTFLVASALIFQIEEIPVDHESGPVYNDCGNAFYDCGYVSHELYISFGFDPEPSTNPDMMFGVLFDPADFGYISYPLYVTNICMMDIVSLIPFGGAPIRRFFIYPDEGGRPDDSVVLRDFYFEETGMGLAEWSFDANPIVIQGPFWVMQRGDPTTPGGTLGIESCTTIPSAGHSYHAIQGLDDLRADVTEDYGIHVQIEEERPALPVPTLSVGRLLTMVGFLFVLSSFFAIRVKRRKYAIRKGQ